MKVLKTVVSGLGRIGWQFHIPSIMANDGFKLTGVCDPLAERRREAEEAYNVNSYACFNEMLAAEQPDLTVIASPTHFHKEQAIYAMEQGGNVFLDKPMACDLPEANQVYEAMKRTGRKLMMYQPHRANAPMQVIKKIIDSGLIGGVFMIKSSCSDYKHRNDWQAYKKYGGGMLNNFGAHHIDNTLYLAGSPAKRVSGYLNTIASAGDAEDVAKLLIVTENNICIDIDINIASAITAPDIIIYGQYGALTLMSIYESKECSVRYFDPKEQPQITSSDETAAEGRLYVTAAPQNWRERYFPIDEGCAIDYYQQCYGYYALDEEPFVTVQETMAVMRLIDACRKAAE